MPYCVVVVVVVVAPPSAAKAKTPRARARTVRLWGGFDRPKTECVLRARTCGGDEGAVAVVLITRQTLKKGCAEESENRRCCVCCRTSDQTKE